MPEETVLAFDFGKKRIGVAVGDKVLRNAHPLTTIINTPQMMQAVDALLREWQPSDIIVGLPSSHTDTIHPLDKPIKAFALNLKQHSQAHIWLVNEQLSSHAASLLLNEAGVRGYKQKPFLDAMAAKVILETWLADGGALF